MMHARGIDVTEFNVSIAPTATCEGKRHPSTRNWSRVLGLAGTLTLHGLVGQSLVLGSAFHKPQPPELQAAGFMRKSTSPAEELVLVTVEEVPRTDPDFLEQIASLGSRIEKLPISIPSPDAVPTVTLGSTESTADESSQTAPEAGDPALRALMFGRYTSQISARIERAWRRPRSPINEALQAPSTYTVATADDEAFRCLVQIRQDSGGNIQEVLLLKCNGSDVWRHSLVMAINRSSPLPAPPIPSVFTRALTMTFEARAYQPGGTVDDYELEPRKSQTDTQTGFGGPNGESTFAQSPET